LSDQPPEEPGGSVERLADHRRRRRPSRVRDVTDSGPPVAARLARAQMLIGPEAPYEPVGFDGKNYWVIGCTKNLHSALPKEIGGSWLDSICGNCDYLRTRYPRMREGKPVNGFVPDNARRDLMNACHELGYWEPTNIRSVGAWLGADGDLILHRGDHLYIRGQVRELGRVGEFVYVPGPPLPMIPKLTQGMRPAQALLDRLETFTFSRGSFDAMLMLGIICVGLVCGALKFRPHCFVVGEIGAGKTALQQLLRAVFGAEGIVDVTDATAAAIWQALRNRSIPIGYDEFEAEADSRKQERILALARQASTGAKLRRGSSGHIGVEFPVVSSFICSSVIAPPLNAADASRFVLFTLDRLIATLNEDGSAPPQRAAFSLDMLGDYGLQLTARLAARWPELRDTVLPTIARTMSDAGYPGRIIDLYGTLIGLCSVALFDDVEQMNLPGRLASYQMQRLLADARAEQVPEYARCLDHLKSYRIERHRPTSTQLGELIHTAANAFMQGAGRKQANFWGDDEIAPDDPESAGRSAQRQLLAFGLRVARIGDENASANIVLQVAHNNQQLAEVFEHTRWRSSPESATGGGWTQALRRAPGATLPAGSVRFRAGFTSRAVNVPIALVLQPGTSPTQGAGLPGDELPDAVTMLH